MIIEHPTAMYSAKRTYGVGVPAQVVQCDFCRTLANPAPTVEKAAEKARKQGFITIKGESLADPLKWACPGCQG